MISREGVSQTARNLVAEVDRVEARYGPVATDIVALALDKKQDAAIANMNAECRPLLATLVKATGARSMEENRLAAGRGEWQAITA